MIVATLDLLQPSDRRGVRSWIDQALDSGLNHGRMFREGVLQAGTVTPEARPRYHISIGLYFREPEPPQEFN